MYAILLAYFEIKYSFAFSSFCRVPLAAFTNKTGLPFSSRFGGSGFFFLKKHFFSFLGFGLNRSLSSNSITTQSEPFSDNDTFFTLSKRINESDLLNHIPALSFGILSFFTFSIFSFLIVSYGWLILNATVLPSAETFADFPLSIEVSDDLPSVI